MKQKIIITDIDDTLLDFGSRIREYFNNTYDRSISGKSDSWNCSDFFDISETEMQAVIDDFLVSSDFGKMEPMSGATTVLPVIVQQGIQIIGLTACGSNETTIRNRELNLRNVFGNSVSEVLYVNPDATKYYTLKHLSEVYDVIAFIDDKWANIKEGLELDLPCYMINQPHNYKFRDKEKVNKHINVIDWYDINNHIKSRLGINWNI